MRSLRFELLASHLGLVVLMATVLSVAISTYFGLTFQSDRVLDTGMSGVVSAVDMRRSLSVQEAGLNLALAGRLREGAALYDEARKELELRVRETLASASLTQRRYAQEIAGRLDVYELHSERLLGAKTASERQGAEQDVRDDLKFLHSIADRLSTAGQDQVARANDDLKKSAAKAIDAVIIATSVIVLAAVLLALRLDKLLLEPLEKLAKRAEALGRGDPNLRVPVQGKKEIAAVAAAFNASAERLDEFHARERKRLQRAELVADTAFDFLCDPVLVTDAKGRIVRLNHAAEAVFGALDAGVKPAAEEHVRDRRILRSIAKALEGGTPPSEEDETTLVRIRTASGARSFRVRSAPMRADDDSTHGVTTLLEDITRFQELDRLKNEFIGVASHELRSPVTSLLLGVQLMEEGAAGPLTDGQKQIVASQKEDLERLERLTRELLDLSKLESGSEAPKLIPVQPRDMLDAAFRATIKKAQAKDIEIVQRHEDPLPIIQADHNKIVRVLVNLIDNAIRHSPSPGTVTISASATANEVTFRVADTGEGVPKEFLSRIFDRFVQVPGATGGGAGLGLSIAQAIVRAHGGNLRAESVMGEGSTFIVELPISQDAGKE